MREVLLCSLCSKALRLNEPLHSPSPFRCSSSWCSPTRVCTSPSPPLPPFQVLLKLVQPYTRVRIPFISSKLNIPEADVEQLLISLILDNRIAGHIDQVRGTGGGVLLLTWSSCSSPSASTTASRATLTR